MAFFALLWKARTIEKYRLNYEKEKINSIVLGHTHMEQTLSQRWRHYRHDTKKRISKTFNKWYPEGSGVANFFLYLQTDQTFPNFLLKSVMGFVGGIILTYLCFMFFVFQLSISLIHATIMSSIIGVLLTLGLAFSYRIRCLVFLLIPQFFSRVGRYTLTCYALVLILTGPATNTLKNSEVLSESMACTQEQIKTSVHQLNDLMKKPYNAMRDSLKLMVDRLKMITAKVKETIIRLDRLVLSIVSIIQSSFTWLQSVADICNTKLGTPFDRCTTAMDEGVADCKKTLGPDISMICNVVYVAQAACYTVKPFKAFCYAPDLMDEAILATVKKKLRNLTDHLRAMFHVEVHIHHSYSFSSNTSRSASQVAAGIVTEIRNRADPLLTWLSWSSCVTSLFLLLIIFRAKYYQHMYETRSRFDNRYVTKELQELDLKRQRQGRETILPLNRRERAKYITTTSFRLVASEKVYLNRSAVFMAITTLKLLIHMVADYSLYWVLMTIRYHGRYQSDLLPGIPHSGVHVSGTGFVARLFRSIVYTLEIPLASPSPSPISCLPDPYPPDLRRYTQIGVLIFLLWFFALFEPYGLRLRHLIMGHYRPERAKARATWLYNHILRTRGTCSFYVKYIFGSTGFMKFARRKLRREYKYSSEASLTFRQWMTDHIPFQCLRSLLGFGRDKLHCLLCGTTSCISDLDSRLTKCETPGCPGIYCISCFTDIGELCTICLSPDDYGDFSDVSLEKGSSEDSDSDGDSSDGKGRHHNVLMYPSGSSNSSTRSDNSNKRRWRFFRGTESGVPPDTMALIPTNNYKRDAITSSFTRRLKKIRSNIKIRNWDGKYTQDWVSKLTPENKYKDLNAEVNYNFYSNSFDIEQYGQFEEIFNETRSIGVNTDKNRGFLLNSIVNSCTRWKIRRTHAKKQTKSKLDPKQNKISCLDSTVTSKDYRNIKPVSHILQFNVIESNKRSIVLTKTLHAHNLTVCQRNLKNIVKSKRDTHSAKDKIKVYEELNGVIKAIRYFVKSNGIINIANENNDIGPIKPVNNGNDTPVENSRALDNIDTRGKRNKKKTPKNNKPKRARKQKDTNKIKMKNSRHRIAGFHTFFSNHWNNFKYSLISCTNRQARTESPITKEKRNHKRRKKRKGCLNDLNETDIEECFARKDIKHTRNLRISAFLAELEWTKRDYKKDKDGNEDSFLFTDGVPAPVTTNKIVGMVQLRNLPFQWREAPRYESCDCKDNKCSCSKQSESLKLFDPASKQKVYAKKALDRFRNKVNSDIPSSLVQKMMSTINAGRDKHLNIDSSICISKRASFYRSFTKELTRDSDALDTDLLFKNDNFMDDLMQDPSDLIPECSKMTLSNNLLGKELIVSRSSKDKSKPRVTKRCRCDVYEDLQRKWAHVKKTISDKGFRNPLSIMKNFCSSLFGPSCTADTCPNKLTKKDKEKKEKAEKAKSKSKKKDKKPGKKGNSSAQTTKSHRKKGQMGIQTQTQKDTDTQLAGESDIENEFKEEDEKSRRLEMENREREEREREEQERIASARRRTPSPKRSSECATERERLKECEERRQRREYVDGSAGSLGVMCMSDKSTDGPRIRSPKPEKAHVAVHAEPEMATGACQAIDCPNYCHRSAQYDKRDARRNGRNVGILGNKELTSRGVGDIKCVCVDEGVQGDVRTVCTCATQHVSFTCKNTVGTTKPSSIMVSSFTINENNCPVANKKTQHRTNKQVAHKGTHYTARKLYGKRGKDAKTGKRRHKLSLESSLCVLDRSVHANEALLEVLTDTITDTSLSSMSVRSDETKTDTTICSLATVDDTPRRRKFRVKVITKTNQATLTDKTRLCDTGTITHDWWSPIVERKANEEILLEKKKGYNAIEKQKKDVKDLKELREVRKRRRNCGVTTDGRIVTFRSRTQIIPTVYKSAGLFPGPNDIMSPSRYLLESQKYYNELFAYNFRPPPQMDYSCVTQMPKFQDKEKTRSPLGSRRNHHRKTKRLDECYSPRRQLLSPRKRYTDSTKISSSESPRRRSYTHRHRHHTKFISPRKIK